MFTRNFSFKSCNTVHEEQNCLNLCLKLATEFQLRLKRLVSLTDYQTIYMEI